MFKTYNKRREAFKKGEFRSELERQVSLALQEQGHDLNYETDRFDYYLKRFYTPDFRVKGEQFDFFIEVKGWFPSDQRSKLLAVMLRHPTLPLFVALQRPHQKLNKTSKTSLCQWCEKHGIAWCPTPIPPDFLQSWVTGQKLSFRAPSVPAATRARSTKTDGSHASAVDTEKTETQMDTVQCHLHFPSS